MTTIEKAGRQPTNEERQRLDAMVDHALKLTSEIDLHNADRRDEAAAVLVSAGGGTPHPAMRSRSPIEQRGYVVEQRGGRHPILAPEQRMASLAGDALPGGVKPSEFSTGRAIRSLVTGNWGDAEVEKRALSETSLTAGGVLLNGPIAYQLIDLARSRAVMFAAGAGSFAMPGPEVTVATIATDPTAAWTAENATIAETDGSFAGYKLQARKLAALTRISIELAEDAPNAAAMIEQQLAAVLALALDRGCLRGTGSAEEPLGILNFPGVQQFAWTNGQNIPGTMSALHACVLKIRNANGPDDGLAVIMSPDSAYRMDTATDGTGQWLLPNAALAKAKFLTSTVIPDNLGVGTNETEIYVGDYRNVLIGFRTQVQVEVSRVADDAFLKGQVLIRAYLRADMVPTQPTHHVVRQGVITLAPT